MKLLQDLASLSIALAVATSASAQEIYSTGFEPTEDPPFVLGDITGQDGWFVAPGAAQGIIQDSVVASGVQALEVIDAASFGRAQRSIATSAILPVFASSYSMYVPSEWAAISSSRPRRASPGCGW